MTHFFFDLTQPIARLLLRLRRRKGSQTKAFGELHRVPLKNTKSGLPHDSSILFDSATSYHARQKSRRVTLSFLRTQGRNRPPKLKAGLEFSPLSSEASGADFLTRPRPQPPTGCCSCLGPPPTTHTSPLRAFSFFFFFSFYLLTCIRCITAVL